MLLNGVRHKHFNGSNKINFHPLNIALDHLTLDRAALYRAILEQAVFQYPPPDLAEARRLIEKHGYWRRKEELEDAGAAIHSRGGSLVVIPVPG